MNKEQLRAELQDITKRVDALVSFEGGRRHDRPKVHTCLKATASQICETLGIDEETKRKAREVVALAREEEERDFVMDCEAGGQIVLEEMHGVVYLSIVNSPDTLSEAITEREARRLIHALSERFPRADQPLRSVALSAAIEALRKSIELRGPPVPTEGKITTNLRDRGRFFS